MIWSWNNMHQLLICVNCYPILYIAITSRKLISTRKNYKCDAEEGNSRTDGWWCLLSLFKSIVEIFCSKAAYHRASARTTQMIVTMRSMDAIQAIQSMLVKLCSTLWCPFIFNINKDRNGFPSLVGYVCFFCNLSGILITRCIHTSTWPYMVTSFQCIECQCQSDMQALFWFFKVRLRISYIS